MEYKDIKIINRIREIMTEYNLSTQGELGNAVGMKQSSISKIFNLERSSEPLVKAICNKYPISPQWILIGNGIKYNSAATEEVLHSNIAEMTNNDRYEIIKQINALYQRHMELMAEEQSIMEKLLELNKKLILSGINIAGK